MNDWMRNICRGWVDVPFWFAAVIWTWLFLLPGLFLLAVIHIYWASMLIVGAIVIFLGTGSAAFSRHLRTKYCR